MSLGALEETEEGMLGGSLRLVFCDMVLLPWVGREADHRLALTISCTALHHILGGWSL